MFRFSASLKIILKSLNKKDFFDVLKVKGENLNGFGQMDGNIWTLDSSVDSKSTFEFHIEDLLEKISSNIDDFSIIKNRCQVKCICTVEGDIKDEYDYNPEISFDPHIAKGLSSLNAELEIDYRMV